MLRAHGVGVREVLAAEVSHVQALQRHVKKCVRAAVCPAVRAIQELLHERPAGERERVAAGDRQGHLRGVVGDSPGAWRPGDRSEEGLADNIGQVRSGVDLPIRDGE